MNLDTQRMDLIGMIGSYLMKNGLDLEAAGQRAADWVRGFERAAQAAWSPATGGMPETPKLAPGDPLLVVRPKTRYTAQEISRVEVTHMARFKVRVKWLEPPTRYTTAEDFDVRTRSVWSDNRSDRMSRGGGLTQIYTEEQWAYQLRADLADAYLRERGIYGSTSVSGPLLKVYMNDVVGFANALRRLEGLVEL